MLTDAEKKLIDATLEIEQDLKMIAMIDASFARLNKLKDKGNLLIENAKKALT